MKRIRFGSLIALCLACLLVLTSCGNVQPEKGEKGEPGIQGERGEQGEKGEQGERGQDGTKITIGANGNWFLDGVDSGIKASCDCNCDQNGQTSVKKGISFNDAYECPTKKAFPSVPVTYEAWIKLPKNYTDRAGVILGNYDDDGKGGPYFSFEIYDNGNPRLYYKDADADAQGVIFNQVNVCTGDWVHLAIVNDLSAGKSSCYVDGVLMQTMKAITPPQKANPVMVGNDFRNTNKKSFKGEIHSVAVYSDVRTVTEVYADVTEYGRDQMLAAWDFSKIPADGCFEDLSGNGHDIQWIWLSESSVKGEYAYSFVVVGDTQSVNIYDPAHFSTVYDWIVKNKDAQKIKYVMGLGDITDKDQDAEWARAAAAAEMMDLAGIEYSMVRGNHDSSAKFNQTFHTESYIESIDGKYGSTLENTYRKVEVGAQKYLIFTLDFGATDDVLNWASGIIEAHADYNVIITTHAYLFRDGTTLDKNDVCPPTSYGSDKNNGDDMWNELISKHENIVLVLSGHDPDPNVVCVQTRGDNGNVVTQILTDHQYVDRDLHNAGMDTTGMVTILHFSEDGSRVFVECYSTVYGMYYGEGNQFEITLHVVG